MNLQSSSTDFPMNDPERPILSTGGSVEPQREAVELSQEFAGELDAESIEASLARAATLIRDLGTPVVEKVEPPVVPETKLKYVLGMVQGQHAWLVTNLADDESRTLLQPQMVWTIGRNREAALSLQDPMMSRRHAVIMYVRREGFYLIDLNSMNGTFVNGVRLQHRYPLQDGDQVYLGNLSFTFFTSKRVRSMEPIHPEVLARLNTSEERPAPFVDYLAKE